MRYPSKSAALAERIFCGPEIRFNAEEVCRRARMSRSRLEKLRRRPTLARVDELFRVAGALGLVIDYRVRRAGCARRPDSEEAR